jgi:hypothetical protein
VLHPSLMRLHCVKAAEMEPSVVTHAQALKMR